MQNDHHDPKPEVKNPSPRNPKTTQPEPGATDSSPSGLERHVSWKQAATAQDSPGVTRHTGARVYKSKLEAMDSKALVLQARKPELK